jgi:hypothetical protein
MVRCLPFAKIPKELIALNTLVTGIYTIAAWRLLCRFPGRS